MIKIKSFKVGKGDAFLLSFGEDEEQNIIIDMGFASTYTDSIREELLRLSKNGKKIDLLIVTHIDADHIGGALKFIKENGEFQKIIKVGEVWHNSYRHLQFDKLGKKKDCIVSNEERIKLNTIIQQNLPTDDTTRNQNISCSQGSTFAGYLYEYKYKWNEQFGSNAVLVDGITQKKIGKINIILLSPSHDKLKDLAEDWLSELEKKKYDFTISDEKIFDDAFECYMQYQKDNCTSNSLCSSFMEFNFKELAQIEGKDTASANGSSIAFIVEYEDRKLLFLGDAHEDIVFANLARLEKSGYELNFDLIKVSHHGSNENISNRLMDIVESKRFLISTNGTSYNHPSIEAISKIIVKNTEYTKEIIFNYDLDMITKINDNLSGSHRSAVKYCNEVEIV